jgi:Tol biopolymer transport system component
MSWAPDGRLLVYLVRETGPKLWALPLAGEGKAFALLRGELTGTHGQVSPDGRWLAYHSNETGRDEIYVRPFPSGSGKSQVSTDGGAFARWAATGRELFYMSRASNGSMMVVDVNGTGSTFDAGVPRRLFETEYINLPHTWNYHTYAVSPDGQRFLIPRPAGQAASASSSPIAVFLNWKPGAR